MPRSRPCHSRNCPPCCPPGSSRAPPPGTAAPPRAGSSCSAAPCSPAAAAPSPRGSAPPASPLTSAARPFGRLGSPSRTCCSWTKCIGHFSKLSGSKGRIYPFYVREFTPLQYTRLDLDDYIEKRPLFTDDEWLDLLVQSIGFHPARFSRRIKLLMLLRLVPFVESNYNMIALGPRETGKTYTCWRPCATSWSTCWREWRPRAGQRPRSASPDAPTKPLSCWNCRPLNNRTALGPRQPGPRLALTGGGGWGSVHLRSFLRKEGHGPGCW